ncbi:AraC family transcriptional regulator [Galbibacter sp. EGI 63066]|uniref:helix-turn-helix domain-containing protein n=1 Tax=Galbibacter sp. EGI 63066 TaxID=2993559 RepID=UPI0022495CE6|nr:AraC family transcriptional regulator [Galbibacter sp. EGI 63066]MCX2680661.1 AraC family transcriptional regulator [Galbibacter sp. EGI 63066]
MKPKAYHNTPPNSFVVYFLTSTDQVKTINTALNSHDYTIVLVKNGRLRLKVNKVFIVIKKGEALILPINGYGTIVKPTGKLFAAVLSFKTAFIFQSVKYQESIPLFLFLMLKPFSRVKIDEKQAELLVSLFKYLRKNQVKKYFPKLHQHIISITFQLILLILYQLYSHPDESKVLSSPQNKKLVLQFFHLVHANFKKEHRVKFYADKLYITTDHLYKTIKKVTGKSPINFIHLYLIREASILLIEGNTIKQISNHLGFKSPSLFGKFFKRHTGYTPSHYQQTKNQ